MRCAMLLFLAVLVFVVMACDNVNKTDEDRFTEYMQRAVQAQQYFKNEQGFWAGDRDHDNHIGNTGFGDGDSVHVLRSHDLNFNLTLSGVLYTFRYGYVEGRGNAAFVVRGPDEHPEPMTAQDIALCKYLDMKVDGYEDATTGRVMGFPMSRFSYRPGSGTFVTTGMAREWDNGDIGICSMMLE